MSEAGKKVIDALSTLIPAGGAEVTAALWSQESQELTSEGGRFALFIVEKPIGTVSADQVQCRMVVRILAAQPDASKERVGLSLMSSWFTLTQILSEFEGAPPEVREACARIILRYSSSSRSELPS